MPGLVIGLDGGGTRTRVVLANAKGETLGTGEAGTSNPTSYGMEAAQKEILAAIERAFQAAHLDRQLVASACFGIGGAGLAATQIKLKTWARTSVAARVRVAHDGEILLAAIGSAGTARRGAPLPQNWGIAIVSGTGSIAWGRARDGGTARAGGWGYLIGDEGSAFDLAHRALHAVAQAADGRGEPTALLPAVLEFWGLKEPMELVPRVYHPSAKPADLAALAPVIARVAGAGDPVAQGLLVDAGDALASAALAVAQKLGLGSEPIPLALTGGILLGIDLVRVRLLETLAARGYTFHPVELVLDPVIGAVRLALAQAV